MDWIQAAVTEEFAASGTDAYRIADGEGCRIERFGDGLIISHAAEAVPASVLKEVSQWLERTGVRVRRMYARRLVIAPGKRDAPQPIGCRSGEHTCIVHEAGLCYEVDFLAGYSCGLFLDQRANRAVLRAAKADRLLNLFAYTCSFSVAGAAAGAKTLSIDLSRAALERGRRNFTLNGLSLEGQRFIADDVFAVLPRLARRGEKFDAIVLDPPTFSRARNRIVFQAERDYGRLMELAFACAAPGALVLLSTNCAKLDEFQLRALGRQHAFAPVVFIGSPALPDIPTGRGAATVWMRVGPGKLP
jgi:23S rRNA (cytosine1962-C5)-methyltransferase